MGWGLWLRCACIRHIFFPSRGRYRKWYSTNSVYRYRNVLGQNKRIVSQCCLAGLGRVRKDKTRNEEGCNIHRPSAGAQPAALPSTTTAEPFQLSRKDRLAVSVPPSAIPPLNQRMNERTPTCIPYIYCTPPNAPSQPTIHTSCNTTTPHASRERSLPPSNTRKVHVLPRLQTLTFRARARPQRAISDTTHLHRRRLSAHAPPAHGIKLSSAPARRCTPPAPAPGAERLLLRCPRRRLSAPNPSHRRGRHRRGR